MVTKRRKSMGRSSDEPRKTKSVVYVHGSNGSGKTTLARVLIACAGGISHETPYHGTTLTRTRLGCLTLVGPYRSATGGADSVQPYALVPQCIHQGLVEGYNVFIEGLITPGVKTCRAIWTDAMHLRANVMFILLNVPIDTCIEHVQARRDRKGNAKPYDPSNLIKKHRSSISWEQNLRTAGIPTMKLSWKQARKYCLEAYKLSSSSAEPW